MGQDISFTKIDSGNDSTHMYSLNRSITGMEINSYSDPDFIVDQNSGSDILAKNLLGLGVESVSIYSSVVTINCAPSIFSENEKEIEELLTTLYRFYEVPAV